MAKIRVLAGDIPPGTEFYTNPGSIGGQPVTGVAEADAESVKRAGMARSFGLGPKVYFIATFEGGKQALAVTDPLTFDRLGKDIADGPVSKEAIADRKKENTVTAIIFFGTLAACVFIGNNYLTGYLPFLAGFCVALAVSLVYKNLRARR